MSEKKEPDALRPFLSLSMAARIVHAATGKQGLPDEDTLNDLARAIAVRTRVFARYGDAEDVALVMPSEVAEGDFEGGGTTLTFSDGRPPLDGLSILHADLWKIVDEMRGVAHK